MFLRFWFVSLLCHHHCYNQTSRSQAQSNCQATDLVNQNRTFATYEPTGPQDRLHALTPPLKGRQFSQQISEIGEQHSGNHGSTRTLEMPPMQKVVQRHSTTLSTMWQKLASSAGSKLCTFLSVMGMAIKIPSNSSTAIVSPSQKLECTEEFFGKETTRIRQKGSEGSRKREVQRIPTCAKLAIRLATCSSYTLASGSRCCQHWSFDAFLTDIQLWGYAGDCGRNPTGISGCHSHSGRIEKHHRQERSDAKPPSDKGNPHCHYPTRQTQESTTRNLRCKNESSCCMVQICYRMCRSLEVTTGRVREARRKDEGDGTKDKARNCHLFRNHQDAQSFTSSRSPTGRRSNRCRTSSTGFLRSRIESHAAGCHSGFARMCQWTCQDQRRTQGCPNRYRGILWRRGHYGKSKTTTLYRTSQNLVKRGSANSRHTMRHLHEPKCVRFEVTEAYVDEPDSQCAAGHFECPEISAWLHSVRHEDDYLSPYHARMVAQHLQWTLACDEWHDYVVTHRLQDPPDPLPIFDREEQIHEDAQPPEHLLIIEDWEMIQNILAVTDPRENDVLHLVTYGLWNVAVGTRHGLCVPTLDAVRQQLHHIWHDIIDRVETTTVYLVKPPPEGQVQTLHLVVEFISPQLRPSPDARAVLRRVHHHRDGSSQDEAAYHYPLVNGYLVIGQANLRQECIPWGEFDCTLYVERRITPLIDVVRFDHGSLIEIFVHNQVPLDEIVENEDLASFFQHGSKPSHPDLLLTDPHVLDLWCVKSCSEEENDGDMLHLMQAYASAGPSRVLYHVFHMPTEHLRTTEDVFPFLTQRWHLVPANRLQVHAVPFPPTDLAQTGQVRIAHLEADNVDKHYSSDRLALIDIELRGFDGRNTIRRVHWIRDAITRDSIIAACRCKDFCDRHPNPPCEVFFNQREWAANDMSAKPTVHGDAITIVLHSPADTPIATLLYDLQCTERIARTTKIFEDVQSSSSGYVPTTPTEEEHIEERVISRSRSRSRDDEQQEPPENPEEAPDSLELLQRRVILLDERIPRTPVQSPVQSALPGIQQLADKLLRPRINLEMNIPHLNLLQEQLQESVTLALAEASHRHDDPTAFWIYTDGSKLWNIERAEEVSAWAFVVVAVWDDGHEGILGCQAAAAQTNSDEPTWFGATAPDSYQAEVEAIIRAMIWLCQEPLVHGGVQCTIVADATSALFATDGAFNIHHPQLKPFVRPLHKFLMQITQIDLRWQKSHVGNVYNELADHMAKVRARDPNQQYEENPISCEDMIKLPWLWMATPEDDPGLPSCIQDTFHLPVPLPLQGKDVQHLKLPPPITVAQPMQFDLRLASHNVNSFKDRKDAIQPSWQGRAELLRQQVLSMQLHVVGWQETRRTFSGQWESTQFIGFEERARKGHGGVAIWFRKDISFATLHSPDGSKQDLFFKTTGFTVHTANAEAMVIEYQDAGWKGIFVTAHAPTDVDSQERKQKFWDSLTAAIHPHQAKDVFVMIDANSRVGSQPDGHIGMFAADDTSDNGYHLHALLKQHSLWLPATFESCIANPMEDQGTWLSKGGWKRIDFIATNLAPTTANVQTWTQHVEKDTIQEDHKAVCAAFQSSQPVIPQQMPRFHATLKVNREVMNTPAGQLRCKEILKELTATRPNWAASADEHAHHLNCGAQMALEKSFPYQPTRPKPSWISSATWSTLQATRKARHRLQALRTTWKVGTMRLILHAWKSGQRERGTYSPWIKQHDLATAEALRQLHRTKVLRIHLLRHDEGCHLKQLSEAAFDELHEAKGAQLWKALKKSLPKFRQKRRRPLPMASAHENLEHHFANIEDAQKVSGPQLVQVASQRSQQALAKAIGMDIPIQELPTVFELEDAIRSLSSQKAFVGCVPAELLKADPAQAAELLYPALLMFFRYFQQPTSWKGGQYFPLYKGKGATDSPGNYRAILIGNVVPKVFHKIVRSRMMAQVQCHLLPFQIGGVPRMSVHFAAHFLQSLRHQANLRKKSSAVLFFDLKSAFYRAQRSTVVRDKLGYGDDINDEDVAVATLGEPAALDGMQVSTHLQTVIQELFSQTWCTVTTSGSPSLDVLRSVRGTRPGDPVADLSFTCIMKQVLERFMQIASPLLPTFPVEGLEQAIPAITWVDDVAIYLEATYAADLIPIAESVVKILHQQCRAVGLDLNYAHGKTEVLFRFHGRNSDGIRRELHKAGKVSLGTGEWENVHLPVATKYTHLGVKHAANMSFDIELNYRLARAREALTDCKKPVLRNPALTPTTRWQLARSLIFSRLFFGSEIWPVLTIAQQQKVQQFLFKVARVILRKENFADNDHTTDDTIGALLPIPSVETLLKASRLKYATRLYNYAPSILLHLLRHMESLESTSWIQRLQQDMQWLQQRTPALQQLLPPHLDFERWTECLKQAKEWTAMVNRAMQADTLHRFNLATYQTWRLQFRESLCQAGAVFPSTSVLQQQCQHPWHCQECDQGFATQRALSVHLYKRHNRHADARSFMDSTVCGSCLKDYHTIQRLRQHLQYQRGHCLAKLRTIWWPFDTQNLVQFKPEIDTKAAHRIPAIQCYGPMLPDRLQWQEERPEKAFPDLPDECLPSNEMAISQPDEQPQRPPQPPHLDLYDLMEHYAAQCEEDETVDPPNYPPLLHPDAFQTIADFSRQLQEVKVHEMEFSAYLRVYGWVEYLLSQHFVMQRTPRQAEEPARDARDAPVVTTRPQAPQPTWISDHHDLPQFPQVVHRQPRKVAAARYILYLYSGHRREGDMVHWAHTLGSQRNIQVEVITIDIVYDAKLCDMRDPKSRQIWLDYVARGLFLAVLGAPPCETYSAARHRAITAMDGGPPPLRTFQYPWGLETNTLRQQKQIMMANELMQSWLLFVVTAASNGTAVLMEHPAPSIKIPEAVSIWRTAELRMIGQFPGARQHMVVQGLYGAVSCKPTTFLAIHIPQFQKILKRWKDPDTDAKQWIRLEGRNSDGSWKTAQGKAYPSRLNAALMDCAISSLGGTLEAEELPNSSDFQGHVSTVLLAQKTSGKEMGPDYVAQIPRSS